MNQLMKTCAITALAMATALPAVAQPTYQETPDSIAQREAYEARRAQYEDQQGQYRDQQGQYRDQQGQYRDQRGQYRDQQGQYQENAQNYQESRRSYREARRDYDHRLAEWNRARSIYDRRYGYGSYARMYTRPNWDQSYWTRNDTPPYAGYYGRETSSSSVRCGNNSSVAGGLIGALAGAVLGSNVAARNARTEGTVLGGVVGAAVGAGVGHANDKYKCDSRGPYFSYDDTQPYREGRTRYSSSYNQSYYERQQCRLVAAPVDAYGRDYRYVRVCPDRDGRFRITG